MFFVSTYFVVNVRIKKRKENTLSEKVSKILNQIKKELEGIKNELKKSNVLKDKRYKEMMKWKKKWKKTHTK